MLDLLATVPLGTDEFSAATLFAAFFFGTFISEDATCLVAGATVAAGETSFALAVVSCLLGIFVGDLLLYGTGRLFGPAVFKTRMFRRLISDESLARANSWLNRNTGSAVFTSRFVSGLRLPMYLAAGAVKADAVKFSLWFLLAAVVWTPILVGAAAFSSDLLSPVVVLLPVLIALQLIRKLSSWTNRRLLIGRIKRITNWEFWPLAVFYTPVVCYIALLALRHRSLTVFTAANPSIPAGGFVGESKDKIYELIGSSPHSLRHVKIDRSHSLPERILAVLTFMAGNKLTYPLVLKPDVGERGIGVTIIRDREQLAMAIRTIDRDMILQEFCDGVEASVFYYRDPGEDRGQIFSITEKEFPSVVGDGRSSIKELILRDRRAVCLARSYFRDLRTRVDQIPDVGQRVSLIEIGTHSRGAIFREGDWLKTPALEDVIDRISVGIDGFYFGRYDIKAESFEKVMTGEFKIIELNGVTSESTNIYDPRYRLTDAYRILFGQWRLAFAIGDANRRRGSRTLSVAEFVRLLVTRDTSHLSDTGGDKLLATQSTISCA